MEKGDILIIGVIYHTYPEATRYVESIVRFHDPRIFLILVDNSESEAPKNFRERIEELDFTMLVRMEQNRGYLHGAREGYHLAVNQLGFNPQWILITNVDIVLNDPATFQKLDKLAPLDNLAVVAPAIIAAGWGTDINPKIVTRYSLARMRFYQFLYLSHLLANAYIFLSLVKRVISRKRVNDRPDHVTPSGKIHRVIYAPHGSCMIFHKNYFVRGGSLNHLSFLFGEEIFIAEEARRIGLQVIYAPEIRITDFEHSSIGLFLSRRMNRYYRQSTTDLIRRYYSR